MAAQVFAYIEHKNGVADDLSLIHISEPTRHTSQSRIPS